MSDTIRSATSTGADQDAAGVGAAVSEPPNRDHAGKLLMVMNGALVGVPSAYAVSNSFLVTAMAAALAGLSAAALLAQRTRRPR